MGLEDVDGLGDGDDGPCPNPEPCPVHPRRWPQDTHVRIIGETLGMPGATEGEIRARIRDIGPRGTAADLVAVVEQVKPVGIRLVGIVVQGRAAPWWWRWVEPVALWLLRRAGFEVCQ